MDHLNASLVCSIFIYLFVITSITFINKKKIEKKEERKKVEKEREREREHSASSLVGEI